MAHMSQSKLEEFGIRSTKQRLELASLLFGDGKPRHVTAEALFQEANEKGMQISQATIYNCLHLFCQAGLIREIAIEGHRSFYDTKTDGHPHFYHTETGELVDAPNDIVKVEIQGDTPKGTKISGVDVVIRLENQTHSNH